MTREDEEIQQKDWHIKDNMIQALNIINKYRIKENWQASLVNIAKIQNAVKRIQKTNKCSLLEATQIFKEKIKKKYSKKEK